MDLIKPELVHLSATRSQRGKLTSIVASKEDEKPLKYLIGIDFTDNERLQKLLSAAGFEIEIFEVSKKDFEVRTS